MLGLELENLRQGESYDSTDRRVDGLGKNPAGETGEGTGRGGGGKGHRGGASRAEPRGHR